MIFSQNRLPLFRIMLRARFRSRMIWKMLAPGCDPGGSRFAEKIMRTQKYTSDDCSTLKPVSL
jgi:hypothetical protein